MVDRSRPFWKVCLLRKACLCCEECLRSGIRRAAQRLRGDKTASMIFCTKFPGFSLRSLIQSTSPAITMFKSPNFLLIVLIHLTSGTMADLSWVGLSLSRSNGEEVVHNASKAHLSSVHQQTIGQDSLKVPSVRFWVIFTPWL